MFRSILCTLFMLCGTYVHAQTCPASFRFVDFGLQDQQGNFFRGGPIYRAVDFSNAPILHTARTQCRMVPQMATDGHGVPIPVVTHITYDIAKTDLDLTELTVAFSENTSEEVSESITTHRAHLRRAGPAAIKGTHSLCAMSEDRRSLSCQIISPYPSQADLVVYCDPEHCRMPVLAVNDKISISASWSVDKAFLAQPDKAGAEIYNKVGSIHRFLEPLSSGI